MKFSLLPKEYLFFDLFDQMAAHAIDAARCFSNFATAGTFDHQAIEKMHCIEENCDEVTHEIIDRLNRTFVTPFDREDIYSLAHEFDSVIDLIQAMTNRMLLYKLNDVKSEDLMRFAELIERSVDNLANAVRRLREGLRRREAAGAPPGERGPALPPGVATASAHVARSGPLAGAAVVLSRARALPPHGAPVRQLVGERRG